MHDTIACFERRFSSKNPLLLLLTLMRQKSYAAKDSFWLMEV